MLRVQDGAITLRGPNAARIFFRSKTPFEAAPGSDVSFLLAASDAAPVGRIA